VKRIVFLIIALVFQNRSLISQTLYGGIDFGYASSLASQNIASNINIGITQTSNAIVKGSFGKGLNLNIFAGYNLTKQICLELGVSYLHGSKFTGAYIKDTVFKQNYSLSTTMLRLSPSIRIETGEGKTKMYLKAGVLIRLAGNIKSENTFYDYTSNTTTVSEWKYARGFSLGALAAVGCQRQINNKINVFSELFINVQSWAPKNGDVIKYTINEVSSLETLNFSQKSIHYVNSYTVANGKASGFLPSEQLKQYHSFNSIGLKIGIYFAIGKNKKDV